MELEDKLFQIRKNIKVFLISFFFFICKHFFQEFVAKGTKEILFDILLPLPESESTRLHVKGQNNTHLHLGRRN